jgi:hypothetical protein
MRRLARQAERPWRRDADWPARQIDPINDPTVRGMLMMSNHRFGIRDRIVSLLAGDFDSRIPLRRPSLATKCGDGWLSLVARHTLPVAENG